MLTIQLDIAKYHCLYIQGAVAFQTSGVFLTHPVHVLLRKELFSIFQAPPKHRLFILPIIIISFLTPITLTPLPDYLKL